MDAGDQFLDLTYADVAAILLVSARTIRAWVARGEIGCVAYNKRVILVPYAEVVAFRARRLTAGGPDGFCPPVPGRRPRYTLDPAHEYSPEDVARFANISPKTVHRLVAGGLLPAVRYTSRTPMLIAGRAWLDLRARCLVPARHAATGCRVPQVEARCRM